MGPDDIASVEVIEELDVARDGSWAVVVQRRIRRYRRKFVYESHLYSVDLTARLRPRPVTEGRVRDWSPRIAPDGRHLAFLRSDPSADDAPTELCVMRIGAPDARLLAPKVSTPGFGDISELAWSPDGSRLAFVAPVDPPRWIIGDHPPVGSKAGRAAKLPSPTTRRMRRTDWRWDEVGHRDRWSHLFVIDAASGAPPRQVTRGDFGVGAITWHPDGRTVAFVADRSERPDLRSAPDDLVGRRRRRATLGAIEAELRARCRRGRQPPRLLARRTLVGGGRHPPTATARRRDARPAARAGGRVAPAGGAGARARPPDRELDRHRPDRLDGLRALRPDVARRAHDRRRRDRPRPRAFPSSGTSIPAAARCSTLRASAIERATHHGPTR